jgi:nicotinamide riboside kinase
MKVAISGSFGVGKSTLFRSLKNYITNLEFISETTRIVMEENGTSNQVMTQEQRIEHQNTCTLKQIELESASPNFITDYCAIDYLNYTFDLPNYLELKDKVSKHLRLIGGYDHVFYIPIEFSLQNDGMRFIEEKFRRNIDQHLKVLFKTFHIKPIILKGGLSQRRAKVLETLKIKHENSR